MPSAAGKDVYQDPYALPLGFITKGVAQASQGQGPFEYLNEVYTKAMAEPVKLF